ncbi:meiosis regulator and mRNA stability factor 1-like [Rhopilema esculentum]|uniref:meiosis regulator and mRNA stability factor 1-like n=1 Tax=Rhopilema esculentum TaxID=499914 RepID=UPI0031D34203
MACDKNKYGVKIENIPEDMTEAQLFQNFCRYGPMSNVKFKSSKEGPRIAYANFYSKEVAEVAANDANGQEIDGFKIKTSYCVFDMANHPKVQLTDCKFFMTGKSCAKPGKKKCHFRHNEAAKKQSDICQDWLNDCCKNKACKKRHPGSLFDQVSTNQSHKKVEKSSAVDHLLKKKADDHFEKVGIYWDIENCQIPMNKSPGAVVNKIRSSFLNGKQLVEFICVCDSHMMSKQIVDALSQAEVNVIHVAATAKNAADDKLKQFILDFGHKVKPPASVVLISGDVNFAPVLHKLRYELNLDITLLHNEQASETLKQYANNHILFAEFLSSLGPAPMKIPPKSTQIKVTNIPLSIDGKSVASRLKFLANNCGGKVYKVYSSQDEQIAILAFQNANEAYKARYKLQGQDVGGNKINVELLESIPKEIDDNLDDFKKKTIALLNKLPYWMAINRFEKVFMKQYKEKCDVFKLCKLKDVVYLDGKPGKKFICLLTKDIKELEIEIDRDVFHDELEDLLDMHNRKVPFASLLGLYWSYYGRILRITKAGQPLMELVKSCPNLFGTSLKHGVAIKKEQNEDREAQLMKVVQGMIQLFQCYHYHWIPVNKVPEHFLSHFGYPCYIKALGFSNIEELLKAIPGDIFEINEINGNRLVSLCHMYKVKHFHDELLELVSSRGDNRKLPLLQLPEQYFKYYGLIFPHANNPSRLRKLLSSLKGDLKVVSDKNKAFFLIRNKASSAGPPQFQQFKKGLISLLDTKQDGMVPISKMVSEYEKFHGSCPLLSSLGFSHPNDLFKALETEMTVQNNGKEPFICLANHSPEALAVTMEDKVTNLLLNSTNGVIFLADLPTAMQEEVSSSFAPISSIAKVVGRDHSRCLILSSKYDELTADDDTTLICKTLYQCSEFTLPEKDLQANLAISGTALKCNFKKAVCNAIASGNISKNGDQIVLASGLALRFFCFELLLLLEENPSFDLSELCGLYNKKFGRLLILKNFGCKKMKELMNALPERIVKVYQSDNTTFVTSDAIGKFLINSKQLLKDNNEAVLQCEFLNFYRNIYRPFKPEENGFSKFSQLLTAFSEFFVLLPPSNVSKTIVINRTFDIVKLQAEQVENFSAKAEKVTKKKKKPKKVIKIPSATDPKEDKGCSVKTSCSSSDREFDDGGDAVVVESEVLLTEMPELEWYNDVATQSQTDTDLMAWSDDESINDPDWWLSNDIPDALPTPLIDMFPVETTPALKSDTVFDLIDFDAEIDDNESQDGATANLKSGSLSELHSLIWS